jgi:HK97 gp10 family phage protein
MAYVPVNKMWTVEGLEDLESQLSALMDIGRADKMANKTLVAAAKHAMEPVANQVQVTAPRGTKPRDERNPIHMADTVRLVSRIPNNSDKKSVLVNETDAAIAVVSVKKSAVSLAQEFGTKKIPGQPFLRRALQDNAEQVVNIFKKDLQDLIANQMAKLSRRRK